MNRLLVYFMALWVGCTSCYQFEEIRIDPPVPHAVLNAMFCPDSLVRANLSRTANDTERKDGADAAASIEDAEVELYVNGRLQGKLEKEAAPGWYRLTGYRPAVGDRLEITARTPDYGIVSGKTGIPGKIAILSVDTVSRHRVGSWGYEWDDLEISIRMRDLAGERNFYLLTVSPKRFWQKGDRVIDADTLVYGYWPWLQVSIDENSPLENGDMVRDVYQSVFYRGFLLTDEGADGQEMTLKLTISDPELSYRGEEISCRNYCRISLSSISRSYYLYRRSRALQKEQNDILGDAGLREPIPTYTNIHNGYGLVASRQEVVYDLELPYQCKEPPYGNPFFSVMERSE